LRTIARIRQLQHVVQHNISHPRAYYPDLSFSSRLALKVAGTIKVCRQKNLLLISGICTMQPRTFRQQEVYPKNERAISATNHALRPKKPNPSMQIVCLAHNYHFHSCSLACCVMNSVCFDLILSIAILHPVSTGFDKHILGFGAG
jgi:hypothetical protein